MNNKNNGTQKAKLPPKKTIKKRKSDIRDEMTGIPYKFTPSIVPEMRKNRYSTEDESTLFMFSPGKPPLSISSMPSVGHGV